jgi:hypothetical protein
MNEPSNPARRALLQQAATGLSLTSLSLARSAPAHGAAAVPISEQDPAAKAVHYVDGCESRQGGESGADCSNCSLYGAAAAQRKAACTLFPGKLVKAAGWCSSWSGL